MGADFGAELGRFAHRIGDGEVGAVGEHDVGLGAAGVKHDGVDFALVDLDEQRGVALRLEVDGGARRRGRRGGAGEDEQGKRRA